MNRRQLKIAKINQKKSNSFHHYYAANSVDGRKLVLTDLKVKKFNLFDVLNNSILGTYREIFNAWNQTGSKIFTYLKTVYDRSEHPKKDNKQALILLQMIPVDLKQEDEFIDIRHWKGGRDGQI